jgi:hypothetical protein
MIMSIEKLYEDVLDVIETARGCLRILTHCVEN